MSRYVTFIAHGSSRQEANDFLINLIRDTFSVEDHVTVGFLEAATPTIPEALEEQIKNGAKIIEVIPLFLVPGNHTTKDIPVLINQVSSQHPDIKINLRDFIGTTEKFKDFLGNILKDKKHA